MGDSRQKFVVLVGDGMGDEAQSELDGRTPLEAARTEHMDQLASRGMLGLAETIAPDQDPGSDVANMAILGYDPDEFHTGRAPLEAASMGVKLAPGEVAFRCNLVTVEEDEQGRLVLADYSAGHISSREGRLLLEFLGENLGSERFRFYPGVGYRHLLVWRGGRADLTITPPHDVTGQPVGGHWEVYDDAPALRTLMEAARRVLPGHEVNRQRTSEGKRPANAIWLWGQGLPPTMPSLHERFGLNGVMISAVDLLKGLGVCAGLEPIAVPGATGYLDTNYAGKVAAAREALEVQDFVYLHVEAPDEASHEGELHLKMEAIEAFDSLVVGALVHACRDLECVRILVVTDHHTPVRTRTHGKAFVPFAICDLPLARGEVHRGFCERSAAATGLVVRPGWKLMEAFITGSLQSA
jgi:2,3-bisphosphoglycerate-independent phosphoglycerate mutase